MIFNFKEMVFRTWYWYVSKIDKRGEVLFMNYGYHHNDMELPAEQSNNINKYSIQLYHHLLEGKVMENKDIVEIGCGRGGGLAYVVSQFKPKKAIGVDLNERAIAFCKKNYKLPGLTFQQGDAQCLKFDSNSFDYVINVESSHRYPDEASFFKEVKRILRPDGLFLFTDFRFESDMKAFEHALKNSDLQVVDYKCINEQVSNALTMDDSRRRNLVSRLTPFFLHKIAFNFAGCIGSETFNRIADGRYVYFSHILKKAN